MEEIQEIAEVNHDDGGDADNIDKSQKIGLSEMPIEILEHILVHLDDKSLLRASHVCTLLASVAEAAFAQKYSNTSYRARAWMGDNMAFHEVMLSKYGDKIRKLEIQVNEEDERLLDLAERTCCNLNSLDLYNSLTIMLSKNLKEARLANVEHLKRALFTAFIYKNQQLEILRLESDDADLLDVLDGLNKLKTLEYSRRFNPVNDLPIIRLNALETLGLRLFHTDDYVHVLRAITCDELKSVSLVDYGNFNDLPDGVVDQICSFGTLVSLQLDSFKVTEDQLKVLARRLPQLTEFGMGITENVELNIQLALRILPKLTKLTITLVAGDFRELSDGLKKSIHDFHARFVVTNTEIELVHEKRMISTSKDRTIAFDSKTNSLELLWMENFNEINKVLNGPINGCQVKGLKIINDFADATVIEMLQRLDKNLYMQIEELSIDTKDVPNNVDQELVHGNDITHILAKFKNLKSLEVVTPAMNFDASHLMSVCPNLNDWRVQRNTTAINEAVAEGQ